MARTLVESGRPVHPRRQAAWAISGGTLEALKWIGLVLMLLDHANKVLFHEASASVYALGRLVMPLFAFVLMYKLARRGALAAGVHVRVMKRLAVFALLASPAFVLLVGWWPLNILATLLVATLMVWLLEKGGRARRTLAAAIFILAGAWVEFWWPGLLCCLGAWAFCRNPGVARLLAWALATAFLAVINGNFAALAVLPLVWGATQVDLPIRRRRWLFYAFYPAHLSALALLHHVA
ncbi:conjugal transfer protein TraX [Variovorax paradoxus]|nr:conjugal transfer protein TraX [Variovorax paradoxus]